MRRITRAIPTNPVGAANWLLREVEKAWQEFDHDSVKTEAFFVMSYQMTRTHFEHEREQLLLFVLTIKDGLEKYEFPWWKNAELQLSTDGYTDRMTATE